MRVPHATSSSRENALSSESIGTAVLDRRERRRRPAARALRRRIGRDEIGVLGFERAQLPHERVELGVGDLGRVEHEVLLVVVLDQLAQLPARVALPARFVRCVRYGRPSAGSFFARCHAAQSTHR